MPQLLSLRKPAAVSAATRPQKATAPHDAEPEAEASHELIRALQEALRDAEFAKPWQATTAEVKVVKTFQQEAWIYQLYSDGQVWCQATSKMFGLDGTEVLSSALMHAVKIGYARDTLTHFTNKTIFNNKTVFGNDRSHEQHRFV